MGIEVHLPTGRIIDRVRAEQTAADVAQLKATTAEMQAAIKENAKLLKQLSAEIKKR